MQALKVALQILKRKILQKTEKNYPHTLKAF